MKAKPFNLEKHNEVGKRLKEFQDYLFDLQHEINVAGYPKEYLAVVQVIKKVTRLQHKLDDRCLIEYSKPEATSIYF